MLINIITNNEIKNILEKMGTAGGGAIGGINSTMSNGEYSCFHSVLQCLLMHPIMKVCWDKYNYLINHINNNNNRYPLTREIIKMYSFIIKGQTANSSNFIRLFQNIVNQNRNSFGINDAYSIKSPGQFLYILLFLLHCELNESPRNFDMNLLNNIPLNQKKDENSLVNLYVDYFTKCHKDSIIFNYFFNTEKKIFNCLNCGMYYDFDLKHIFYINLSNINEYRKKNPDSSQCNVNLYECFDYYCNNNNKPCQYCRINLIKYVRIFNGNTLIISFERNSNSGSPKSDVDFPIHFNFSKYAAFNEGNNDYTLKSCISYGSIPRYGCKYFADINLDANNNSQGRWVRYIDSHSYILESCTKIYDYKPQILIYQSNDLEENININNINVQQNVNNNNNHQQNFNDFSGSNFIGMYNNFINNQNNINNVNNQINSNMNNSNGNNFNHNNLNNQNVINSFNNNNNINYNISNGMFINQGSNNGINNANSLQQYNNISSQFK